MKEYLVIIIEKAYNGPLITNMGVSKFAYLEDALKYCEEQNDHVQVSLFEGEWLNWKKMVGR
jgi:hypothetical protein